MEAGATPSPRPLEPEDLVGQLFAKALRVERLVSTGANTAIYDAHDERTSRLVTLKLIRPRLAASPAFRNRFDTTMRAVSALSHPHIAAVYDWGVARLGDTSTAYVVIEHLAGGSLRDMFDRGRQLTPSQALTLGLEACRALDHAHRRRFVHTEINPAKIVFGDDRRLRIVDFGLARLLGAPAWQRPDSVPTHVAWYAAPEQGLGQPLDGRTDVYALCLTLHEAVTGTLPFKSDSTVASLAARVGKLMPVSADLGPLAAILERAGRPDAEDRSTAAEFGKGLLQAAAKLPRPEPLSMLSSSLFDVPPEQLRSPSDPTGGVYRPVATPDVVIVPLDEPDSQAGADPEAESGDDGVDDGVDDDVGDGVDDGSTGERGGSAVDDDQAPANSVPAGADDGGRPTPAAEGAFEAAPSAPATDELVILPIDVSDAGPSGSGTSAAEADVIKRRRGIPWKILAGVLVLGALVALGVLATRLFERPTHVVPDVTGRLEAEAENLVAPNKWDVEIAQERSDERPEPGRVIRTTPSAGVELREGERFTIVVSEGPLLRELPESTGLTLSEAQAALADLRMQVDVEERFDETIAAGTVIEWMVPLDATLVAGTMVEPDTLVNLVVSLGPAPRTVPNLSGLDAAAAQTALADLGLVLVEAPRAFSDDVPLGAVISQGIAEGEQVERGSEVSVVISQGPDLVVFPDLTGLGTFDEAAAALRQAGFEPVLLIGDAQGSITSFTIDGEAPQVGTAYRRGTVVEFQAF